MAVPEYGSPHVPPPGVITPRRRPAWLRPRVAIPGVVAIVAVVAAATVFVVSMAGARSSSGTFSLFATADLGSARQQTEDRPMEVGVRFATSQAGTISAVRFLKAPGDPGPHQVHLWAADGTNLATVAVAATDESESGWQTIRLPKPVKVVPGDYVASYHTTIFMASERYFGQDGLFAAEKIHSGPLTVDGRGANGVYGYGEPALPARTDRPTNFWVDVVYSTEDVAVPDPTAAGTPTGDAAPATGADDGPTPTPGPSAAPPNKAVPDPLPGTKSWAGYYTRWRNGPNPGGDQRYFPIGVWMQDPSREATPGTLNGTAYQRIGVNLGVGIWEDESYKIRHDGLLNSDWRAFVGPSRVDDVLKDTAHARNVTGYLLDDEPDMLKLEGDKFHPQRQPSGMNALADKVRKQDPSRPTYINFSKWMASYKGEEGYQRIEYGSYEADMRAYCKAADLVSADLYGYTDPWEGADQEGAWAYGELIDNVRKFCGPDKPVWGFVETAQPFYAEQAGGAPPITPDQMEAAIWNMLIHGANGWVYFSHDFGYGTGEDSMLRTKAIKAKATAVNARVKELAPVLNTFSSDGVKLAKSSNAKVPMALMHKVYGGGHYLFAQTDGTPTLPKSGAATATITVPVKNGTAKVLYENRTVNIVNGQITDTFKPYQVHIYQF